MKVLFSVRDRGERTNPYIRQTADSLPPSHEVMFFSWRRAFSFDYDVFHVHWPEGIVANRRTLLNFIYQLVGPLLIVWLKLRKVLVVRTVHNTHPHETLNHWQSIALSTLDKLTTTRVYLTGFESRREPPDQNSVHIPHGHYKDWFSQYQLPDIVPGRLLFFGLIRGYKNVPRLIREFTALPIDRGYTLHVAGSPENDVMRRDVELTLRSVENVSANLTYLSDEQLAEAIGQAELVVLPYSYLENSGAVLLALSLARPVLVPETISTLELQAEFGPHWVLTYSGELTSVDLEYALSEVQSQCAPEEAPDLSSRDWHQLGKALAEVYEKGR